MGQVAAEQLAQALFSGRLGYITASPGRRGGVQSEECIRGGLDEPLSASFLHMLWRDLIMGSYMTFLGVPFNLTGSVAPLELMSVS